MTPSESGRGGADPGAEEEAAAMDTMKRKRKRVPPRTPRRKGKFQPALFERRLNLLRQLRDDKVVAVPDQAFEFGGRQRGEILDADPVALRAVGRLADA